ncbi:transcription initiation factor TFIID subunit 4-like [Triticum urartu]|uniref:transcription initiation factor TFIID subunit 4-like n=1 Tax=Triticum urartu TaxID=4572 RepID=UPI0020430DD0|nr:transcription initiation factor TFIID subunit 4-like [Triticum urartu]
MTGILNDLVTAVQGIRLYLAGPYGQPAAAAGPVALPWYAATTAPIGPLHHHWPGQPPPAVAPHWLQWPALAIAAPPTPPRSGQPQLQLLAPLPPAAAPQWPQWPAPALAAPPTPPGSVPPQPQLPAPPPPSTGPGSPSQGGVPIQQVRFPPSPSPIPAWLSGSSPPPVYTSARDPPAPTLQFGDPSGSAGHSTGHGILTGHPNPRCFASPSQSATALRLGHRRGLPNWTSPLMTEDPLNWLNQCEQFFRGQRTLASERTWLASYHLRGAAQTWYYALEQDEGSMPPWERFRELCLLRFGPPIHGSRLAELGRLLFTSTVQDFADRFQALACHASGVTAHQRADFFVSGLPDHIRVDVELRGPQDLQTAMYYARAPPPLLHCATAPRRRQLRSHLRQPSSFPYNLCPRPGRILAPTTILPLKKCHPNPSSVPAQRCLRVSPSDYPGGDDSDGRTEHSRPQCSGCVGLSPSGRLPAYLVGRRWCIRRAGGLRWDARYLGYSLGLSNHGTGS